MNYFSRDVYRPMSINQRPLLTYYTLNGATRDVETG